MRSSIAGLIASMCAAGALLAPSVQAHHSFAMYDRTRTLTFTGKLTRFIPGANHAQLIFELVDENGDAIVGDDGNRVAWGVETGPAASIAEQGITVASFPVGTVLTVSLNPLRDGRTFGVLAGPIVKCGAALPAAGCTSETGESFGNGQAD